MSAPTPEAPPAPPKSAKPAPKRTPDTYWLLEGVSLLVLNFLGGLYVRGEENVPREGAVLLVSNHVSYLDPVSIGDASPRRVVFMAKDGLFENKILNFLLRGVDSFPVKRGEADPQAFRTTLKMLGEGRVVCIFPEGTRNFRGEVGGAEPGAGVFATRTGCTVVPVYCEGTAKVLSVEGKWRRGKITVTFGTPFTMPKSTDRNEAGEMLMAAIRQTRDEATNAPKRRIWPHWIKKPREGSRAGG